MDTNSKSFELVNVNIVILANNFNPSIVSKEWLRNKQILMEEEKNFIHTPRFSILETEFVSFIIDPNRVNISIKKDYKDHISRLPEISDKFVSVLPETPYKAIGFNFHYVMLKEKFNILKICTINNAYFKDLFSPEFYVGLQIKFAFEEFAVKMDFAPPIKEIKEIMIDTNFHYNSNDAAKIKNKIASFQKCLAKAEQILTEITK